MRPPDQARCRLTSSTRPSPFLANDGASMVCRCAACAGRLVSATRVAKTSAKMGGGKCDKGKTAGGHRRSLQDRREARPAPLNGL